MATIFFLTLEDLFIFLKKSSAQLILSVNEQVIVV
jgi:hypothetical protein